MNSSEEELEEDSEEEDSAEPTDVQQAPSKIIVQIFVNYTDDNQFY